jgi:hypothetical protein
MVDFSPAHVHLLLNHVPTVGFMIGLGIFVFGLALRSDDLKRASLVVMTGIALVTIPTFTTGAAAQAAVEDRPGVSLRLIEMHEGLAFLALLAMQLAGGLAWLGLWHYRRMRHLPPWNAAVLLAASVVALAFMAAAANLGGQILHPEIRVSPDADGVSLTTQIATWISRTPPAWAIFEALHFIGLSLVIGVVLLVNARILGMMKQVPFGALERLLPWAVLGYGVNVITGMLFFITMPGQYIESRPFYWKLLLLMLAGANTVYFLFDKGWDGGPAGDPPTHSRLAAASALALWIGVMYWGSMLPFLGETF